MHGSGRVVHLAGTPPAGEHQRQQFQGSAMSSLPSRAFIRAAPGMPAPSAAARTTRWVPPSLAAALGCWWALPSLSCGCHPGAGTSAPGGGGGQHSCMDVPQGQAGPARCMGGCRAEGGSQKGLRAPLKATKLAHTHPHTHAPRLVRARRRLPACPHAHLSFRTWLVISLSTTMKPLSSAQLTSSGSSCRPCSSSSCSSCCSTVSRSASATLPVCADASAVAGRGEEGALVAAGEACTSMA